MNILRGLRDPGDPHFNDDREYHVRLSGPDLRVLSIAMVVITEELSHSADDPDCPPEDREQMYAFLFRAGELADKLVAALDPKR